MLGLLQYDTPPLLGIYFAEFDNALGPRIVYQVSDTALRSFVVLAAYFFPKV